MDETTVMKTLYPVVALSAALLLAACSEDKPATETDAAKTTTTEQAAPAEGAVTEEQEAVAEEAAPEEQEAATEEQMDATDEAAEEEETDDVTEESAPEEQEAATEEAASEGEMGSLADLSQYIGKYPNDGVNFLTISPLAERLQDLLGDDYDKFQGNMETVGPLSEENGLLYITGNKDNDGGTDAAALVIDPEQDTLFVWTLIDGAGSVVTESEEAVTLPADVQTMMENSKQQ